jgi:hypothetical protein
MKPKLLVQHPTHNTPPQLNNPDFSARPSGLGTLRSPSRITATGAAPFPAPAKAAHWQPKFPFDLVVTYETEATRARAFTLCGHLIKQLDDDHDIRQSWWKFPFLYDPQLLERATDVALSADMIVISLNHGKELPFIARTWIEGWVSQKNGRDTALVALVENTPSARCSDCPALRYLNSVAHKAGMDFFPHAFATAPLRTDSRPTDTPAHAPSLVPLLEEILRRPNNVHPWGINEY